MVVHTCFVEKEFALEEHLNAEFRLVGQHREDEGEQGFMIIILVETVLPNLHAKTINKY